MSILGKFRSLLSRLELLICFGLIVVHAAGLVGIVDGILGVVSFFLRKGGYDSHFGGYFYSPSSFWTAVGLAIICGCIGIGLCYHRLLTHASFKTYRWLTYFFTVIGMFNLEGGPIQWVGVHRLHHKHTDTDEDPHSPLDGAWWAHVFWVCVKSPRTEEFNQQVRPMLEDRGFVWLDKHALIPPIGLMVLLFGIGFWIGGVREALCWVIWGVGVRTLYNYHTTWAINSVAHMWGYQNHNTGDGSRNVFWLIFAWGEQNHNNHHAQPWAARHGGARWYECDLVFRVIQSLELLGLAWEVRPLNPRKLNLLYPNG